MGVARKFREGRFSEDVGATKKGWIETAGCCRVK
jgi:hypothetical protein